MQIFFTSFGDTNYARALDRIYREARHLGVFDDVFCWSEKDLDDEFKQRHAGFIRSHPRGFGNWIWKGQVIKQSLRIIPPSAILFYADAGCSLNPKGLRRLLEYGEMIFHHPAHRLVFQLGEAGRERLWTKKYTLQRLGMTDPRLLDSPQFVGGIFGLQKVPLNETFVSAFCANLQEYDLITDEPIVPNDPGFQEHRHDQSVWSVMNKLADPEPLVLKDETYFHGAWDNEFPIHARRLLC